MDETPRRRCPARVLDIITDGDLLKRASTSERAGLPQVFARRLGGSGGTTIDLVRRTAGEVMTANPVTVTDSLPQPAAHTARGWRYLPEARRNYVGCASAALNLVLKKDTSTL